MILRSLRLENVRSYRDLSIEFAPGITTILGPNGAGKSTLLQAVAWGLLSLGSPAALRRHGAPYLKVTVEFQVHGRDYRVVRERRFDKGAMRSGSSALYETTGGAERKVRWQERDITEEIVRISQIEPPVFQNAILVSQGEIDGLVRATPAEREAVVSRLLGIEEMERVWERMARVLSEFEREAEGLRAALRMAEERKRELKESEVRRGELARSVNGLEGTVASLRRREEEAKTRWDAAEARRREALRLREEAKHVEAELRRRADQEREAGVRLQEVLRAEAEAARAAPGLDRLPLLEEWAGLAKERRPLLDELAAARERLARAEAELERARRVLPFESEAEMAALHRARLDELTRELRDAEISLEAGVAALARIEAAEGRIRRSLAEIGGASGPCPLCRRPLSESHRRELIEGCRSEARALEAEREKIRAEERGARSKVAELRRKREEWLRLPLETWAGHLRDAAPLRERVTRLETQEGDLARRLEELARTLGGEPGDPAGEVARLREAQRRFDRLQGLLQQRAQFQEAVDRARREREEAEARRRALDARLAPLREAETEALDAARKLEEARAAAASAAVDLARAQEALRAEEERVRRLEREVAKLQEAQERGRALEDLLSFLGRLRSLLSREGLQREIRTRARPMLERYATEMFGEFQLAYSALRITEDYNLLLLSPETPEGLDLSAASGGERVAAALALRAAIARLLAGSRLELLVLDEPTVHLDDVRRRELVPVLRGLGTIPQILVVTHDEELEAAADVIWRVRKEGGVSAVEVEAPGVETMASRLG